MRDSFISFLCKFLRQGFLDFPEHLLDDAWVAFSEVLDVFKSDISAKYSTKLQGEPHDLFHLISLDPSLEGIFYYRIERALFLRNADHPLLPYLAALMRTRTSMEIYYSTRIGPGLNIQHGTGIVIGPRFSIGDNFTIHQGVTLGHSKLYNPDQKIQIGNNVTLFAGVSVIGNISIGDNVQVGANAVVTKSLPANCVYAGIPAKPINTVG